MMMGPEEGEAPNARLYSSTDTLESVALDASSYMTVQEESAGLPAENFHPLSSPKHHGYDEDNEQRFAKGSKHSPPSNSREDPLVEPPSYADVIFSPYRGETVNNGSSRETRNILPLSSSSSSSFTEYLTITVSHPQKVQDNTGSSIVPGSNNYVTYLIVTHTNIPQYGGQDFAVRRRFRDVVTLADRLAEAYRGFFIPARPDKNIVESQVMQKQEFIEQRRVALEKYLRRLANHPVIRLSSELRLFLHSQGKLPLVPTTDIASRMLDGAVNLPRQLFGEGSAVMTPQDVVQPAKGGRDLVRLFKELKQSVSVEWGGMKPSVIEEDKEFLERKVKLEELESKLNEASQQAEALIKAQQEVGETMGELGLAFIKLAKFESEEALYNVQRTHAADVKRVATAAVKASRLHREANAQSVRHLDHLHEYLGSMHSVHTAFNDRSNALLTVQTLITEIASINTRMEKLAVASSKVFGGDRTRNRKIEELKEALTTTEEARGTASIKYERIKEINRIELKRFDSERHSDFLEMIKGFVLNQIGYAEKITNVWSRVAEEASAHGKAPESPVLKSPRPF